MPVDSCMNPVCRDVATPQLALHLLGPPTNPRHDNWVDPSVKLGGKTTVGAGCIIGPGTAIGDKGSVKRSVVGSDCRIGSNAKVPEPSTVCSASNITPCVLHCKMLLRMARGPIRGFVMEEIHTCYVRCLHNRRVVFSE